MVNMKVSAASFFMENENYFDTSHINDFVKAQILSGKKVVLVSHAEGSNIVSKVLGSLSEKEKTQVGSVYVAPTRADLGTGVTDYVLNSRDSVIAAIAAEVGNTNLNLVSPLSPKGIGAEFSAFYDFGYHHEF